MLFPSVCDAFPPNIASPVQLLGCVLTFIPTISGPNGARFTAVKLEVTYVPCPAINLVPNTVPVAFTPAPGEDIAI